METTQGVRQTMEEECPAVPARCSEADPYPAAVPAPSGGWGLDMPISSIPGTQSCFLPGSKHSADAESHWEPRAPLMVVMTCSQTEGAKSAWGPSGFSTGLGSHLFLTSPGVPCALHTALSPNSASGQGSPQLGI